jgi:hypothetical protein
VGCPCACEDRGSSPTLTVFKLSISKPYQLSSTDPPVSTAG